MCTGFSILSPQKVNYLARTMDFDFEFNGIPIAVPSRYHWEFDIAGIHQMQYGFIGTGVMVGKYRFGDGVNEHGLAVSNHYFTGEASYAEELREDYFNMAPEEFILWVLGFNDSIAMLKEKVNQVNIVALENKALGKVPPLHFIITDETGATISIEPNHGLLVVKDNPVHVLTNNPKLEWHLENLRNHVHVSPVSGQQKQFGEKLFSTLGVEGGTHGLPGGFTSEERFVRAAYLRHHLELDTEQEFKNLNNCFKVLDNVSIPRGAVTENGVAHYTQYQCVMDCKHRSYFIKPYNSSDVFQVDLNETLLNKKEITYFSLDKPFSTQRLN
ncbi:penicillin acylase [Staphylococcus casei]|uniref:choloylglycine hydrolase family protein n=1 Tax=Staphylococcus TaxID=1279 RepID=UPI000CD198F7|nr:choloylglycine hydrolase family protein [Staphylococcus casei]PNZ58006.1 penicillin acylase [Staphylococcus casei]WJE86218.1 choloylglycine hydrolase family protein [Staphylococcus casei]